MTQDKQSPIIGFIGGGNMAAAMISGLISKGFLAQDILVSEPSAERVAWLSDKYGVSMVSKTQDVVDKSDVVVLAVKPQVIEAVAKQIDIRADRSQVFVSIAAGTSIKTLENILGHECAIVRLMPNMPALVGAGMSGLYANANTDEQQKKLATTVAESFGECLEVQNENDINLVTALSGSGPAYFLLMMQCMISAGEELGMRSDDVKRLVGHTALGAAKLALLSDDEPDTLCQRIASPGGTTEAALTTLHEREVESAAKQAVKAAYQRALELSV